MEITAGMRVGAHTFLGRGGMGTVYLAEDHELGRHCAIKVLHEKLSRDATVVDRFRQEVRAAGAVNHPAIVKSLGVSQLPDGSWYYVMEYIEGPTLRAFCRERPEPLPLRTILEIIGPLCEAFDQLHMRNIIHRDLKPENVLITTVGGRPFPNVLDFGVAKRVDEPGLTRPGGSALGTAAYMAPEQAKGGPVDRRCDVYSMGVLLYWMATGGHLPYEVSDSAMYHHQLHEPPTDPRRYAPDLSLLAVNVIAAAIHRDADQRPRTMGMLALMLARCIESDGFLPDGMTILRGRAPSLLRAHNLDETIRSPSRPVQPASPKPDTWKYQCGPVLGRGGMAEVIYATLRGEGHFAVPRALKLILPEFSASEDFVKHFVEEARVAALLEHRNIVRVLDHDRDPQGRLYLAMEFIDGVDLNKLFNSGPVPHSVTIFILSEVLEALDHVHNLPPSSPLASPAELAARGDVRGLVHRDVSHHNVMVSWSGDVKLTDFGVAKLRSTTRADGSQFIKGKPGYVSPEQASAQKQLDGRSDLWSVGVMLWELLTGQLLFDRPNLLAMLHAVLLDDIAPPQQVRPDVPADLNAIAMRLLQRELSLRYQTARDVISDLRRCAAASPDGRDLLMQLLAERYPARARQPSRRSGNGEGANEYTDGADSSSAPGPLAVPVSSSVASAPPWEPSTTTGHASGQAAPLPTYKRGRWPMFAAIGLASATLATLAIIKLASDPASLASSSPVPPAPVMPPAPPVSTATSPSAAAVEPATVQREVEVLVTADPPEAQVTIEAPALRRVAAGRASARMTLPPGTSIHVRAELAGYRTTARDAVAHDNLTIALPLPEVLTPPVAVPSTPSAGERPPAKTTAPDPRARKIKAPPTRAVDPLDGIIE